jgi:hypothetical protein
VFRRYRAAFGNTAVPHFLINRIRLKANKLPSHAKFAFDRARVVGGSSLAQGNLDSALAFVQRAEFKNSILSDSMAGLRRCAALDDQKRSRR